MSTMKLNVCDERYEGKAMLNEIQNKSKISGGRWQNKKQKRIKVLTLEERLLNE
jgi:hypothetical protein